MALATAWRYGGVHSVRGWVGQTAALALLWAPFGCFFAWFMTPRLEQRPSLKSPRASA